MKRGFQRKYFVDYLLSSGGLFLLLLFVGKFYYLKELDLPLSYDESYYWDWSRHLDFGYYSKPPMVAWLIYLSVKAFGISEFAVRLPALLCNTGTLALLYVFTFKHFGEYLARAHLFVLSFVPIFFVYSFVMTIDPPLLFFWALTLYTFTEYLLTPAYLWAILSGISLGLALLTKQTAFLLGVLLYLYLLIFERSLLKLKRTYLIFLIAGLLYLPNLYWNYQHSFVLLAHTEEHFKRGVKDLDYYVKFFGGLFLLFGPVFVLSLFKYVGLIFTLMKLYLAKALKFSRESALTQLKILNLFFFLSFPPLVLFLFLSIFKVFNHNWLMPFFLTSYLWSLYFLLQKKKTKVLYLLNLLFNLGLCLLILALPKKPDLFGKTSALLFYKFYGWREVAQVVEKYYDPKIPLVTSHRAFASSLAFYMKSHPEVYVVNLEKRPENQYHLWRRDDELQGKVVLFVQKGLEAPPVLKDPVKLEEVKLDYYGKDKSFSVWKGIYQKVKRKDELSLPELWI